jgi:hypothetical protein
MFRVRPSGPSRPPAAAPREEALLEIQRSAGNAAVLSLFAVQRDDDEPTGGSATATETAPSKDPAKTAVEGTTSLPAKTGELGETKPAEPEAGALGALAEGVASGVGAGLEAAVDAVTAGGTLVAPAPAGPSFVRDPGCDIEAPALPTAPTARTFTADPKAALPPKEVAPDLSLIPSDKAWWDDAAAKTFGDKLADCYASRGLTSGAKVDKTAKLADLQADFDQVVRGWFGRTRYGRWDKVPDRMASLLQAARNTIVTKEKAADAKVKKEARRSATDLDATVEAQMQQVRFDMVEDVRLQVAIGTWGWMAERREKLDFDTIKESPKGARASLAELLTDDETRAVVHDILVAKKKELTAAEIAKIHADAQKIADAAAKKAGKASTPLTDDEKAAAVAKAERDRVKASWASELKTALIKARTTKDDANLVAPTTSDVKGWNADSQKTRIHKDLVALLKVLETEFPKGFNAATYRNNVEGDHASSGFEGRFRSLDMYPNGGPSRTHKPFGQIGFFDKQVAFDFAKAIDRAVAGKGTFQILYNDFEVAREVNKVLKNGRVFNIDNVVADKGGASNLNWHGPLVSHFHVDFAI